MSETDAVQYGQKQMESRKKHKYNRPIVEEQLQHQQVVP